MSHLREKSSTASMLRLLLPPQAYVYDVDGVLADATGYVDSPLLDEMTRQLTEGKVIGINSKRSLSWLTEYVVDPLEAHFPGDRERIQSMQRLMVMGEMGSVWMIFNEWGGRECFCDAPLTVPHTLFEEIHMLAQQKMYASVFAYANKQTMMSMERVGGVRDRDYTQAQENLVAYLQLLLQHHELDHLWKIDATRLGTDIKPRDIGKDLGTRRFFAWLQTRNLYPLEYIVIGDSITDLPIGNELYRSGMHVTFVFVGLPEHVQDYTFPFPVLITQARYCQGTLEYLKKMTK